MKQEFIKAGFSVIDTENKENTLLNFIKEHYPNIIKDNEINLKELKSILGLPVDEKVNGYGLNFVGRNFARAKYAQKTEKELKLNTELSKNIDATQNLVLKGDNLDCLKILKNYYSGKIKCIYIDPPYNTANDEFVYPDKFDKEEAEVLGIVNLSEDDFARMEFAFSTKKSHNGWLAFMYPRLLLARDLLSKDGVIFISIDDNEQANLKLLCDDLFGEENFVAEIIWKKKQGGGNDSSYLVVEHEYILFYSKIKQNISISNNEFVDKNAYPFEDENGKYNLVTLDKSSIRFSQSLVYEIVGPDGKKYSPRIIDGKQSCWRWSEKKVKSEYNNLVFKNDKVYTKFYAPEGYKNKTLWIDPLYGRTAHGKKKIKELFDFEIFEYPKPVELLYQILKISTSSSDIILDFFAGSGTTGHAVMQLNAEDGGNRKFILCQIDEPIKADKPAYKFCIENNLPPVISSITIERLKRAGEKIKKEIEEANSQNGMFEEYKKQVPDIGFKVFDTVEAPKLKVDDIGQIQFPELNNDALSRIYNMIFTVGLDEPTQVPEEVVKDCVYKVGNHYYITNSEQVSKEQFSEAIKNGKVFIDGWTASLNGTLQNYKEDVKIVF